MRFDFRTIDNGKHIIEKYQNEMIERLKEDNYLKIEEVKQSFSNLSIIISFGQRYWAGADYEIILVYNKVRDTFHWIYIDPHYFLQIKNIPENDLIFKLLQQFHTDNFEVYDQYFKCNYHMLEEGNFDDIGFGYVTSKAEFYDIWSDYVYKLYETRYIFNRELTKKKQEEKQQRVKEGFYEKYKDQQMTLCYEDGKIFVKFEDGMKCSLNLKEY